MWKIIDTFDDSNDTGKRIAYTVQLEENAFVTVMNCVDQDNLFYAMELEDAKIVYDETGNSVDYTVCEKDVIAFVKSYASTKASFIAFVTEKLTERGDKDIKITNVRIWKNGDVLADVSYTWRLNGWEKHAEHKDWIAVFRDGQWHSPHIW